ncbi:uncharacterized protein LOC135847550 [Planococcus citri]|uniref:uncharacterized protein LOC135847550 n=1 Tax=Planococcus citri TaxID=170843 RepID=UPI0031F98E7C
MNSLRFFFVFTSLWCWNYVAEVNSTKQNGIIFNPDETKLLDINPQDQDLIINHRFITACPASSNSEDENILNQHASITSNSLFVQKLYNSGTLAKNTELGICDQPLTPQLLLDDTEDVYHIGYELFYEKGTINLDFTKYYDFYQVSERKAKENPNPNMTYVTVDFDNSNIMFGIKGKEMQKLMAYYWINVLSIIISSDKFGKLIAFEKDTINYPNTSQTMSHCETYYLEDGKILDNESHTAQISADIHDKTPRLEKTQILPMQMFHTQAAKLATCNYLNVAFIWNTVANQSLKEVDLFLYAMYQLWPSEIELYFGVIGKSDKISPDTQNELKTEDDSFQQFAIPQMIFRVVKYKTGDRTDQVVIIIHNDKNPMQETDRLCSRDPELESWKVIENKDTTPGMAYACELTPRMVDKLEFYYYNDYSTRGLPILKLDKFPEFDASKNKIVERNVLEDIRKRIDFIKTINAGN